MSVREQEDCEAQNGSERASGPSVLVYKATELKKCGIEYPCRTFRFSIDQTYSGSMIFLKTLDNFIITQVFSTPQNLVYLYHIADLTNPVVLFTYLKYSDAEIFSMQLYA